MSDEEKKAIESLKNIAIYIGDNYTFSQQGIRNLRENLRIVLPVIEKQQKEIEELKEKNEYLPNWVNRKYISKDKIKAKIEELEKQDRESKMSHNYLVIPVLQSLLEKE